MKISSVTDGQKHHFPTHIYARKTPTDVGLVYTVIVVELNQT